MTAPLPLSAAPPPVPREPSEDADSLQRSYDRTRMSLIERLADWEDQRVWEEFYQTYWRLIYSVSLKAGLGHDEAMDVVQETVITIAKQWKGERRYDPAKGSFKTWLLNLTRWRIADQFRKKQRNPAAMNQSGGTPGQGGEPRDTVTVERLEDEDGDILERLWEMEWKSNLTRVALDKVRLKVSPRQYQIFDAYVVKGWEAAKVRRELGVSMAQVYLAKHRVGAAVKQEVEALLAKHE